MALSKDEIQEKIDALEAALATRATAGSAGTVSVTIDGVSTTFSIAAAIEELRFWESRLQTASRTRKMVRTIDLRGV
jgi:hypothetical protein